MRGADKMKEVLSQRLLISLPRVLVTLPDRRVVLKPVFSMSDGFGRLVIESSDAAQILRYTALRSHRDGKSDKSTASAQL